ncbi:MAG: biopolymer transporter ExbD [Planctomycetota bacterium]|nr:biopolymer transporter ExbD [Planctomycetota bacterium]
MNLAKHDPETDMEMNMTPMIDVVFLLIIFFMIITDLTQKDLEDLELPMVQHAVEDKPKPDEWRPILNIKFTGEIIVTGTTLYDPANIEANTDNGDEYAEVKKRLSLIAEKMTKEDGKKDGLPDDALLIRADMSTPFKYIQKVMEICAGEGIKIWKVQLAASVPDANAAKQ